MELHKGTPVIFVLRVGDMVCVCGEGLCEQVGEEAVEGLLRGNLGPLLVWFHRNRHTLPKLYTSPARDEDERHKLQLLIANLHLHQVSALPCVRACVRG
jgi:hypothetical protein